MNKIQRFSRFLRWVITAAMVLTPIYYVYCAFFAPENLKLGHSLTMHFSMVPAGLSVDHALSISQRGLIFLVSLIPLSLILLILNSLSKLFQLYERHCYFTLDNVRIFRMLGLLILIRELVTPVMQAAFSYLYTWQNAVGHRMIKIDFGSDHFGVIISALFVILISWIMSEGHRLNEEQQLTV